MSRYQDTPIGPYQLSRLIGVGPVSRVYLARRQDRSEHRFALKLFEAVPLDHLEEKDQALDEIRMLACLEHPAILPILDDGLHENMLYLVEPYSEAGSLRQRLTANAGELLPLKEVMALLRQVGEALQFAHRQQIIHANLKPENILFQSDGKVMLADFRLPSLVKSERAARILSTFAAFYMAPEQFQGAATPLSDQYALACLAYELLTGRPPFDGDDFISLARKHTTKEPMLPSLLQPKRAQHIDHVLLKALVKRPEGRYPDIQTFLEELSAPPPLVALAAPLETILGVVQPPAELPELTTSVIVTEAQVQPSQEALPAAIAVLEQETVAQVQASQEVVPAPVVHDVHEIETTIIPAMMPGSLIGVDQQMGLVPVSAQAAVLPARAGAISRFTRRQIWLTVGLVALALLISISGLELFLGASSSNHPPAQVHVGGVTSTLSPTSASGQTPTGAAVASSPTATTRPTATATTKPTATATAKPSPTATATPTPAPTATPTTAVASLSCQVNYSASQLWPGGFIANLTITNTGSSAIQGWKLVFTFPGQERILSGWNGSFTQSGAQVSITNSGSNGTLAPGSSATPGFQATSSSKNESTPAMFSLNGVTCQ